MDAKAPFADCDRCPLRDQHFVPGYGPRRASRVIVGLAPGDKEVREGKPFVGPSGVRLDKALMANGADRSRIYFTNTVLCRPPDHKPGGAVSACFTRLIHEIHWTRPRKVIALGEIAGTKLTGDQRPIGQMRKQEYTFPGLDDCELRVTYHPGAVIRNEPLYGPPFDKDIGWLREPAPNALERGRRAVMRDLFEQGYSTYEIGRIFGINEARIRWMLV
jgi:uracil-DNA glycosylase